MAGSLRASLTCLFTPQGRKRPVVKRLVMVLTHVPRIGERLSTGDPEIYGRVVDVTWNLGGMNPDYEVFIELAR